MHNPPAWSIGRIQSSKTTTLLNNHKSMHLSVLFHHKNGKTTIKTESFLQQSSVDHDYDYIQFNKWKHQQFNRM